MRIRRLLPLLPVAALLVGCSPQAAAASTEDNARRVYERWLGLQDELLGEKPASPAALIAELQVLGGEEAFDEVYGLYDETGFVTRRGRHSITSFELVEASKGEVTARACVDASQVTAVLGFGDNGMDMKGSALLVPTTIEFEARPDGGLTIARTVVAEESFCE